MIHEKYYFFSSDYFVRSKEEAVEKSPVFKAQLRDKTIRQKAIVMKGIAKLILNGYTVNFGSTRNKKIIGLDIDNNGPVKATANNLLELLNMIDVPPTYIFKTFSNTDEHPKYRILIALNDPITDPSEYTDTVKSLVSYINYFYPDCADPKCCNSLSLFYPCKECIYSSPDSTANMLSLDKLTAIFLSKPIVLNLKKFFTDVLHKANLLSETKYERYYQTAAPTYFFRSRKRNLYNSGMLYYSIKKIEEYKIVKGYSYRIDKQNFIEFFDSLQTQIEPIFEDKTNTSLYLIQKINEGSIELLFNSALKEKHINALFDDSNDSYAKILETETGIRKYIVVKKSINKIVKAYSVVDFFMEFFRFKNSVETVDYLLKICNITFKNNGIQLHKTNIRHYKKALEEQLWKHKHLYNILCSKDNNCTKYILQIILDYALTSYDNLKSKMPYGYDQDVQLFANSTLILKVLNEKYPEIQTSKSTIEAKIILLAKLGLIKYVDPSNFASYISKVIYLTKKNHPLNKQYSVVSIPHYSQDLLKEANRKAKEFLKYGNNMVSALYFRNEETVYNSEYYQDMSKYIKDKFDNGAVGIIQPDFRRYLIERFGYSKCDTLMTKYKYYLLKEHNLKIVTLNRKNLKKFGVTKDIAKAKRYRIGYTNVFVKEEA